MLQISQALDAWLNKGFKGPKCKALLNFTSSRIKLLKNKRGIQLKQLRKELAQLLENGLESTARLRVEHIMREQNLMDAYDILEHFCELLIVRMPIMDIQRECPVDLKEAVASIIFAAPRASDLPELLEVKTLFSYKYGNEFVASAAELRPDCGVNRMIIEKLSARAPTGRAKAEAMHEIAEEFNVEWDSTSTELEFSKIPQDLLDGTNQLVGPIQMSPIPSYKGDSHTQECTLVPLGKGEEVAPPPPNASTNAMELIEEPKFVPFGVPTPHHEMEALPNRFYSPPRESSITQQSGLLEETLLQRSHSRAKSEGSMNLQDIIEAVEAAAESAERAAQAARAAAELCRSQISPKFEGKSHIKVVPQNTNFNVPSLSTVLKSGLSSDDYYNWTQEYSLEREEQNGNLHTERINSNGNESMLTHGTTDDYDWTVESYLQKPQELQHVPGKGQPDERNYDFYGEAEVISYPEPLLGISKEAENIFAPFTGFPNGQVEHGHSPVYDTPQFDGSETAAISEPFRRQVSLEDDPYYTYPNLFSKSSSK